MAQVPDVNGIPQVSATASPPNDYQNIRATPQDFGADAARGQEQLGQGISQAGKDMTNVLVQRQQRQNEIGVDDMMNNFQQHVLYKTFGGDPSNPTAKGLYQLQGKEAMDAGQGVAGEIHQYRDQISNKLNPAQKIRFDEQSNRLLQYTQGEIARHLDAQQTAYGVDSNNATINIAKQSASLQWNNPEAVAHNASDAMNSASKTVQLHGNAGDANIVKNEQTRAASGVIMSGIEGALAADNPIAAKALYDRLGSQLDPVTREHAFQTIDAKARAQGAAGIAQTVMGTGATGKPTFPMATQEQKDAGQGHNDTWNRMLHIEGGTNPDGSPRTSSAGAVGRGQLMFGTYAEIAQAHNIPYDPVTMRTDQALNGTLGRLYFGDMLKRYNGNDTLAAAAYNGGPGAVDSYIKQFGDPRTGAISDRDWAQSIPNAETRNYALNTAQPKSKFLDHEQGLQQVRALAQQQRPGDALYQQQAEREYHEQYAMTDALEQKQQAENQKAAAASREAASNSIVTAIQTDITHFDPQASISKNDALTSQEKIHLWDWYNAEIKRQQAGGSEHGYGSGYEDLYKRVFLPEGDPNRITDQSQLWPYLAKGELNSHGHQSLSGILSSKKSPDGAAEQDAKKNVFSGIQAQVEAPLIEGEKKDSRSTALWGQATVALERAYQDGKAKGLTYKDMLDEKSPNYIGGVAKPFIRNSAQKLKDQEDAAKADADSMQQAAQALPGAPAAAPPPALSKFTPEQLHAEAMRRGLIKQATPAAPTGPQVPTN